jgi:hypothetical protein
MKIIVPLLITLLYFSCSSNLNPKEKNEPSKEIAYNYLLEVYDVYHYDYQKSLEFTNRLADIMKKSLSNYKPDSSEMVSIDSLRLALVKTHQESIDKLEKIKSINCKNDIKSKAKENINGQTAALETLASFINILIGGIDDAEKTEFKTAATLLSENAKNIEYWKDDLIAFRKEFKFGAEEMNLFKDRYGL